MDLESLSTEPLAFASCTNRKVHVATGKNELRLEDEAMGPVPFLTFLVVSSAFMIGVPLALGAKVPDALGMGACFIVPILLMAVVVVAVDRAFPSRVELDFGAGTLLVRDGTPESGTRRIDALRGLQVLSWEREMQHKGGTRGVPHTQLVGVFETEAGLERLHLLARSHEACDALKSAARTLEEHLRVPVRLEAVEAPPPPPPPAN